MTKAQDTAVQLAKIIREHREHGVDALTSGAIRACILTAPTYAEPILTALADLIDGDEHQGQSAPPLPARGRWKNKGTKTW